MCAVKLDMMKAYGHVEWHYLEAILKKLGFSINMVTLIMKCLILHYRNRLIRLRPGTLGVATFGRRRRLRRGQPSAYSLGVDLPRRSHVGRQRSPALGVACYADGKAVGIVFKKIQISI